LDSKNSEHLVIGSRGSRLALWQANWVKSALEVLFPSIQVNIEVIKTTGDIVKDAPLTAIGGKGVFTKEIEDALLNDHIDIAVHSLKDLPTTLPDGLIISAITQREDPHDALVLPVNTSNVSIKTLPAGSVIGTSSARRLTQLRYLRPDLQIKELRGNVDTRLRKLDSGEYDGLILASAGLRRLGLSDRINEAISIEEMLPAVGQGALGIEIRANDSKALNITARLNHASTNAACTAERAFLRSLGGGCQVPIAAHAMIRDEEIELHGLVASTSSDIIIRDKIAGTLPDAYQLGETLANRLLTLGANEILFP
jgi:hydroxymethylbilane synthase